MAQFKKTKDARANLTVIEVFGDVCHGEILVFLESLQIGDTSPRAIFDFRSADLSALMEKRIKAEVAKFQKFARPEIRAAMVFSNPADFSIGKVISKAISKEGYLAEIRGFYNVYRAKDWLLF